MSVCHNQYRVELQSLRDGLEGTGGLLVIGEDGIVLSLPHQGSIPAETIGEVDHIASFLQLNKPRDYSDVSS